MDTAHILRKVVMSKYKTFSTGNNSTCTMNCNYKIAVTLYTLEAWFVQLCNYKYPAYNDDDDDDDDNNNNNNNNNNQRDLSNHMLCIMPAVCLTSMLSLSRDEHCVITKD